MNITELLSESRSASNTLSRVKTIFNRFGFTSHAFEMLLEKYSALADQFKFTTTLPITAIILKRYPELIKRFVRPGIEFAVHGYLHIDYRKLSIKEQIEDFKKARDIFNYFQVPFTGFRAPYLKFNNDTSYALGNLNFQWNSSHSIYWDVIPPNGYPKETYYEYLRVLDYYHALNCLDWLSLPEFSVDKRLIEIPVSLPDDEAIVERLRVFDPDRIAAIWNSILRKSYARGELFTLQLHPERVSVCSQALTDVIHSARELSPVVWIATLNEIADWWKEKENFFIDVNDFAEEKYRVRVKCSGRATVLIRNCKAYCASSEWSHGYRNVANHEFILESPQIPVIGVGLNTSPEAVRFLQNEGYPVEAGLQSDRYSLYLNNLSRFKPADKKSLVDHIEYSEAPLVRFWRWPYQAKSALTITGDIDSVTLFDFLLRLVESRKQNKRQQFQFEVARVGATI